MTLMYLWRIVDPLSIYKKLVLVLSFWQVQDRYKVIMALEKGKRKSISAILGFKTLS